MIVDIIFKKNKEDLPRVVSILILFCIVVFLETKDAGIIRGLFNVSILPIIIIMTLFVIETCACLLHWQSPPKLWYVLLLLLNAYSATLILLNRHEQLFYMILFAILFSTVLFAAQKLKNIIKK